jgi:hypothetical protein
MSGLRSLSTIQDFHDGNPPQTIKGEQNGYRQRLEGYRLCQQRPPLAVA